MRNHYWTCSKFADWIRGTPKLGAGTSDEWDDWRETAKVKSVRYWLAEEGLSGLQNFVMFIPDKIHAVNTISITVGLLVPIVLLLAVRTLNRALGVTLVIGFYLACLMSWLILSK